MVAAETSDECGKNQTHNKETNLRHLPSSKSNLSPSSTISPSTPPKKHPKSANRLQTTTRSLSVSFQGESFAFQTKKPRPLPRKPILALTGAENSQPNEPKANPILLTVRLLLNEANLNISNQSQSLDSAKMRAKPRGICVPARFRHNVETPQKLLPLASPKYVPSVSPRQDGDSRTRRNIMESYNNGQVSNAPSIISFSSEVRRGRKGESRIEDAHMLRLLHNRFLQWRYINARAQNAFSTHLVNAKNNLYDAWITISELHELAMNKQIKLEVQKQNLKLGSMLKGQIAYLDEWFSLDNEHENSLRGVMEALKASTLRLPVIGGAKMDIQEVKDAINSTVGVMQSMIASTCCSLSKVEKISSLASELAKAAAYERALLDESSDLLSIVTALHVKQCSVQGYILQLERETSLVQLQ